MNILVKTLTLLLSLVAINIALANETPQVSQQQLLSMQSAPKSPTLIILDVRTQEEFDEGHIQGAINISHNLLSDKLTELDAKLNGDKSALIVVHCRSGRRAAKAEEVLRQNNYTNVRHLAGDIKLWQENNLPLVKQ